MAVADLLPKLRRMIDEPSNSTVYTDPVLTGYVENYPLTDEFGSEPSYWLQTIPPTKAVNPNWIPTYDLNAAAAEIWGEKAAALAGDFDYQADGGSFSASQAYEHAVKQQGYFRSRKSPRSIRLHPVSGTEDYDGSFLYKGN